MTQKNGNLPQGWAETTLGELGEWGSGGTPNRGNAEFYGGGIPWLKIGDLNDRIVLTSEETITTAGLRSSSAKLLPVGSLLVAMYGSIGKLGITGLPCATNQAIAHCLPHRGVSSASFLAWLLRRYRDDLIALGQGGTQQNISQGILRSFRVVLPPLPEQHRIAAKIEELQARSRRTREALDDIPALLDKFRQSVLASAFRGDLTADWRDRNPDEEPACELLERIRAERRRRWEAAEIAKMRSKGKEPKDNRWKQRYEEPEPVDAPEMPELPEGWMWATFDELTWTLRSGTAATSLREETDWPVLRSSAVRPGEIDFADRNFLPNGACTPDDFVSDGDLLITRLSGSLDYVGNCAIVMGVGENHIAYPDRLFRARTVAGVHAPYIEMAFAARSLRDGLEEAAKSSAGHQRISMSDLKRFRIPLPGAQEQQVISDRVRVLLESQARSGEIVTQAHRSLTTFDQAVLAKAFRGKLVPQDPNDEPASVLLERIRAERDQEGPRRGRGRRPARPAAP